ncbi:hypothetical protein ACLIIZ_08845 [Azonexus caeni]
MKPIHFIAAILLGLSGLTFAAGGHEHGHEHKPLHGGIVAEVKDMDYELVAKPEQIQLFLRNHGKAVDVSQASARVTLLSGADKQEVELKPNGDRLEANGSFKTAAGAKILVTVTFASRKISTARFTLK